MFDLNKHNQEYYFKTKGTFGVPDILARAIPIQEAIRLEIESRIKNNPIKILELGFGSRPDRYLHISKNTKREWQVCLSDFSLKVLPLIIEFPDNSQVKIEKRKFNLLTDSFPDDKYDVILSTYVFDSIEFPKDLSQMELDHPKGMIEFIKKSLRHLNSDGLFLTIDKWTRSKEPQYLQAGGAKFKPINLEFVYEALLDDFSDKNVELQSLNDFLVSHGQEFPLDLSDHGYLSVQNST